MEVNDDLDKACVNSGWKSQTSWEHDCSLCGQYGQTFLLTHTVKFGEVKLVSEVAMCKKCVKSALSEFKQEAVLR